MSECGVYQVMHEAEKLPLPYEQIEIEQMLVQWYMDRTSSNVPGTCTSDAIAGEVSEMPPDELPSLADEALKYSEETSPEQEKSQVTISPRYLLDFMRQPCAKLLPTHHSVCVVQVHGMTCFNAKDTLTLV